MKFSQKIIKLHLIFMGLTLLYSCENHVQEDLETLEESSTCDPDISYKTVIEPIIANNCLGCHAGSQAPNLSSYIGVSDNAAQIKFQVVNGFMPQTGFLTQEEIDFISCWVDNGAINN